MYDYYDAEPFDPREEMTIEEIYERAEDSFNEFDAISHLVDCNDDYDCTGHQVLWDNEKVGKYFLYAVSMLKEIARQIKTNPTISRKKVCRLLDFVAHDLIDTMFSGYGGRDEWIEKWVEGYLDDNYDSPYDGKMWHFERTDYGIKELPEYLQAKLNEIMPIQATVAD